VFDRLILFYLVFGMIFTAIVGVLFGIFVHYGISIALAFIYFIILGVFVFCIKR